MQSLQDFINFLFGRGALQQAQQPTAPYPSSSPPQQTQSPAYSQQQMMQMAQQQADAEEERKKKLLQDAIIQHQMQFMGPQLPKGVKR